MMGVIEAADATAVYLCHMLRSRHLYISQIISFRIKPISRDHIPPFVVITHHEVDGQDREMWILSAILYVRVLPA